MISRQLYQVQMEAQLRDLTAKLGDLTAKVNKATVTARSNFEEQISSLQAKQFRLHSRLKKLEQATDDNWEMMKDGVDAAAVDLRRSLERGVTRFNTGE